VSASPCRKNQPDAQPTRLLSVAGEDGLTSVPEVPPSHLGLLAVPSKMLDVLKGSNLPVKAASFALARKVAVCSGVKALKVLAA
jgi:hypothetical protein